ncbi:MAG TPA: sensor domain-containing protein [Mycobacterium sp.]|nr:sensor domain-containing protein [Mycobacterium sp.]
MRVVDSVVVIAVIGSSVLASGCAVQHASRSSASARTTPTTTTTVARPLDEDGLKGLLLSPDQINPIMGATEMEVTQKHIALSDDSATMQPRECLAIDGAGQSEVYANTGYTAVREQTLRDGDHFAHYVDQVVVLFPSAKRAADFFGIEAEAWPSCHEYTHTQSGSQWTAGPIAKADGVLSTVATQQNSGNDSPWACGRALTARNNVVIDVNTCSADPKDTAAVIAGQIAAKVPVQ